jgi:polar amino acid transport system permease protein
VSATDPARAVAIKAVPIRHPWRWVFAALVLWFVVEAVYTLATAPHLRWEIVWRYLFQDRILLGLTSGTLLLTVLAMVIGITLGVLLAVMRLASNPVMSVVSWFYIWFFRGTPVLVQLFFWWELPLVLPQVGVSIPFTMIGWHTQTVSLITPFLASILGLGLNEGAYMAEIVRAGIISVEHGQTEAAMALGMRRYQVLWRIVLPQAMKVIIPPTGNETISMLKTSSLAFVTTFGEMFRVQQEIAAFNFRIVELLIVVSFWYLLCTSVLTVPQYYVERYFARGSQRELPLTPWQRFRRMLFTLHEPPPFPEPAQPAVVPQGRDDSGQGE